MTITTSQLAAIMPRCPSGKLSEFATAIGAAQLEGAITTTLRAAAWLANIAHETGELRWWVEDLDYSAEKIQATWTKRFPSVADALPYAHAPHLLANKVYCDRMGNGPQASGDGWKFRGRGPVQITGREAYLAAGHYLGLDLVSDPDVAAMPGPGFRIAAWFWAWKKMEPMADAADFVGVVKAWNGGLNGLQRRVVYYERARLVLKEAT